MERQQFNLVVRSKDLRESYPDVYDYNFKALCKENFDRVLCFGLFLFLSLFTGFKMIDNSEYILLFVIFIFGLCFNMIELLKLKWQNIKRKNTIEKWIVDPESILSI